jgi:hypothetical protein
MVSANARPDRHFRSATNVTARAEVGDIGATREWFANAE